MFSFKIAGHPTQIRAYNEGLLIMHSHAENEIRTRSSLQRVHDPNRQNNLTIRDFELSDFDRFAMVHRRADGRPRIDEPLRTVN